MTSAYIRKILDARIYDVVQETPINEMRLQSKIFNNLILLKREDLQPVFSFKIRGAYNKMLKLSLKEKRGGVICASAGNHAQGVALAAEKLGIKATIVMPRTTPEIKVSAVKEYGARVLLHGDTFDEACSHAECVKKKNNLTFIHPYDDPHVIAGQGTIGVEILRQYTSPIYAIFIPVGGGGLISGIGTYIKYIRPEIKIIGVEAYDSACLTAALEKGRRVTLPHVGIFADGVAVAKIGKETFRLAKECVDEVITASTDEICAAIKDIFDDTRSVSEPAGALGLAGLKKYIQREKIRGKTLLTIESGANINFDRLRHITERSELGEKREIILAVMIPEKPGSFRDFCHSLGKNKITEFNYRYSNSKEAHVFVGIELAPGQKTSGTLIKGLEKKGFSISDLTENELAILHIRHMVGGRAHNVEDEILYRFEFPERPGALLQFLKHLGTRWSITMFHYRNHGAAYGRVFLGLKVPAKEKKLVTPFLQEKNYRFFEESDNPSYKIFLR